MKKFLTQAKNKIDSAITKFLYGDFQFTKKTSGDSHFMSVMVVIIIVLVVAVLYRKEILNIMTNFFAKATTQIDGLFPTP